MPYKKDIKEEVSENKRERFQDPKDDNENENDNDNENENENDNGDQNWKHIKVERSEEDTHQEMKGEEQDPKAEQDVVDDDDDDDTTEEMDDDDDEEEEDREPKVELRVEIRHHEDDNGDDIVRAKAERLNIDSKELEITDPKVFADLEYIKDTEPTSRLEIALNEAWKRKESHIYRLTNEVTKLKTFMSKRKQTYKRKRKDEGAPTRALSAYNIFIKDRFAKLAKENEAALKSADLDAQLRRVPPAKLVASTGTAWKEFPPEEKAKYEERAKVDRKRYEEQMAQYQPPDKQANRKRNKTGYNMFFSAHVLRLKQSDHGVPSERGSVARFVGAAWKQLSAEEKQYYEREADKHNGMNPVEKDGDEEVDEEVKQQLADPYAHMHGGMPPSMHPGMPPSMHPGMPPSMHPGMHHHALQPDPRHPVYGYPPHHMYGQPPHGYYDYGHHSPSRHHQQQQQQQQQGRSQGYVPGYPPQQQGHPYNDQRGMPM